jgi:hypothetical protein
LRPRGSPALSGPACCCSILDSEPPAGVAKGSRVPGRKAKPASRHPAPVQRAWKPRRSWRSFLSSPVVSFRDQDLTSQPDPWVMDSTSQHEKNKPTNPVQPIQPVQPCCCFSAPIALGNSSPLCSGSYDSCSVSPIHLDTMKTLRAPLPVTLLYGEVRSGTQKVNREADLFRTGGMGSARVHALGRCKHA